MTDEHSTEDAVVTGASTHNQRIERLWTRSVGSFFQDIFPIKLKFYLYRIFISNLSALQHSVDMLKM